MKYICIFIFFMVSNFCFSAQNPPDEYLVNTIEYLKNEPVSLFDMGIFRLNYRVKNLPLDVSDHNFKVDVRYDIENNKILVISKEFPVGDKLLWDRSSFREKDEAKVVCSNAIKAIKAGLGVDPKLKTHELQYSVSRLVLGSFFSHEHFQYSPLYTGRQIAQIMSIESTVLSRDGAVRCNAMFESDEVNVTIDK